MTGKDDKPTDAAAEAEKKVETEEPAKAAKDENIEEAKASKDESKPANEDEPAKEKPAKVSKKESKKDVKEEKGNKEVILHCHPPSLHAPSSSAFVTKLETFLRIADIKYKKDTTRSKWNGPKKGKSPWIEVDGKPIEDTQHILEYFRKKKDIDLEKGLSAMELAVARAFRELFESHFYFAHNSIMFGGENDKFAKEVWGISGGISGLMAGREIKKMKNATIAQGMGRHSPDEIIRFAKQDLQAVSVYLGDKPYLLGDKPTVVDCSIFGHLVQTLYHSPGSDNKVRSYMVKKCHNLVTFVERIRETYYSDWNELCKSPIPTEKEQAEIDAKKAEEEKEAAAKKEAEEKEAAEKKAAAEKKEAEEKKEAAAKKEKEEAEKAKKEKEEKDKAEEVKEDKAAADDKEKEKEEKPKKSDDEAEEKPKKEEAEEKPKEKEPAAADKEKEKEKEAAEKEKEKEAGEPKKEEAAAKKQAVVEEKATEEAEKA